MKKVLLTVMAFAILAACGTSPEPDYFLLAPVDGAISPDVKLVVEIRRPFFPEYLDRLDIVAQAKNDRIRIDESNRWAEPLDRMFERVLAEDLRQRLPAAAILAEDEGLSAIPRVTVTISVTQFNRVEGGQALLQADVNVQDKSTHEQPPVSHIRYATNAGTGVSDLAESLGVLTGKLADALAPILQNQAIMGESSKSPAEPDPQD